MLNFNALIDGGFFESRIGLKYKFTRLEIPEEINVINDDDSKYCLHGWTPNFRDFYVYQKPLNGKILEQKVSCLEFCDGIVLNNKVSGVNPCILENPHSILLNDGRFFTRAIGNDKYFSFVEDILKTGRLVFFESGLNDVFKVDSEE